MALTYRAIATVTVGSGGSASIDFTNIPATYTDLVLKLSLRDNRSGSVIDGALLRFNNDTTSGNYTGRRLLGDGSNASSSTNNVAIFANAADSTASTFSNTEVYIPNYTGNTNKSYSTDTVQETNGTTSYMALSAGLWSNTAAITSIKITPEIGTTFNQYSTATLYGIKNTV